MVIKKPTKIDNELRSARTNRSFKYKVFRAENRLSIGTSNFLLINQWKLERH